MPTAWGWSGCTILCRQRTGGCRSCGLPTIHCRKLGPVPGRLAHVLNLLWHGVEPLLVAHGQFGWRRLPADPSRSVEADPVGWREILNRMAVNVVDDFRIYVVRLAVVHKRAVVRPVATVVSQPRIAEAVIDAAIISDVAAPIPFVPAIAAVVVIPIRRGP